MNDVHDYLLLYVRCVNYFLSPLSFNISRHHSNTIDIQIFKISLQNTWFFPFSQILLIWGLDVATELLGGSC